MALLEESPVTQPKEATSKSAQLTQADSPVKEAIVEVTQGSTREEKPTHRMQISCMGTKQSQDENQNCCQQQ